MGNLSTLIGLLAVVTALAAVAERLKLSTPIVLVLAGLVISFVPGLPSVALDPEVVILIFLPPLVYAAAWGSSWTDIRANLRPILLLSLGLVLFTVVGVAGIVHAFIPGFSWPTAFLLGAIVSPTDPVAGTSIVRRMGLPRRIVVILEAESLVNDATGLIAYRYALVAVLTGQFAPAQASGQFIVVVGAGILIGLVLAWTVQQIHKLTAGVTVVETTLTFLTPFVGYLVAEYWQVSGVLAVLTAGLYLTNRSSSLFSRSARLQANEVWNVVVFLLNGLVFILMGLQLQRILNRPHQYTLYQLITYGAVVSAAVVLIRFVWVYPATYLPRWLSPRIRQRETAPGLPNVTVVAWIGMRGVLSLATALALPLTLSNRSPFPQRDLILFCTFCVIVTTLVLQGLALPYLVRWLGIRRDNQTEKENQAVRLRLAVKAIEHIESTYSLDEVSEEVLALLKHKYEIRISQLRQLRSPTRNPAETTEQAYYRMQQELLTVERQTLLELQQTGQLSEEVKSAIEYELDLEESRLALEQP